MVKKLTIVIIAAIAFWYFYSSGNKQQNPPQASLPHQSAPKQLPAIKVKQQENSLQEIGAWPLADGAAEEVVLLDSDLNRKNYLLIFDGSGSMADKKCSGNRTKADVAKDAVSEWSRSVAEDANLGLIAFDKSGISVRLSLGLNNRDQFQQEIDKIVPKYKTPLTDSLNHAYTMLTAQARRQLGYGEYTIVIVTDGVANDRMALAASVDKILAASPVMISTIGFCIATSHSLNQIGRTTYKGADDPAALRQGLREILAESESFDLSDF